MGWRIIHSDMYDALQRDARALQEMRHELYDERKRYDALVTKVLTLDRTKATVHPPAPSDEVKAKQRDNEAAVVALAGDLRTEYPEITEQAALSEARRILRVGRGEE